MMRAMAPLNGTKASMPSTLDTEADGAEAVLRICAASEDYPGSLLDVRVHLAEDLHEAQRSAELARAAGYSVALHALLIPEDLAVHRVAHRVSAGGHPVPEDKIRGRYARLWPLVAAGILAADSAHVYDNSQIDGPREVACFASGFPDGPCRWPAWTPSALASGWPT